jgi:hypothetical protein
MGTDSSAPRDSSVRSGTRLLVLLVVLLVGLLVDLP